MLAKIGLDESALKCGVHEPFSAEVARELARNQKPPNVLQNNCSGKHAAMLALAVHIGAATEGYDDLRNPVQQMISKTFADFSGVPLQQIAIGVDGCGVPVFGVPVRAMALMYARLVAPESFDAVTRDACQRIIKAMIAFPEMVGGTKDRLDTEMIKAGQGRLISENRRRRRLHSWSSALCRMAERARIGAQDRRRRRPSGPTPGGHRSPATTKRPGRGRAERSRVVCADHY